VGNSSARSTVRSALAALVYCCAWAHVALAQTVVAPFNTFYSVDLLGSVPGVPTSYGGLTFADGDPDTILIGGAANAASGALYSIGVIRNEGGHITGFDGTATRFADAPYNDGGVTYGPDGVLFLARWPVNQLAQLKPGSVAADKVLEMAPFGVPSSLSALSLVPPGFPGAGRLKMVTYSGGSWHDAAVVADGNGTFDLVGVSNPVQIVGAPEGFVYVPPGSPLFSDFSSMLVAEYGQGKITTYQVDDNGDPIPATRAEFVTGLTGAEGAVVDPRSGDFLFSTFGGSNQVVAVRGFGVPNPCGQQGECPDPDPEAACILGVCNPFTNNCDTIQAEDGTACGESSACDTVGQCLDGQCVGQEPTCPTAPGCTDACDEETGECRECGHPFRNDGCVVNAVFVLQGALDLRVCELCTCDVDSSGTVTASDALEILRGCAGLPADLQCSVPTTTTSTTVP